MAMLCCYLCCLNEVRDQSTSPREMQLVHCSTNAELSHTFVVLIIEMIKSPCIKYPKCFCIPFAYDWMSLVRGVVKIVLHKILHSGKCVQAQIGVASSDRFHGGTGNQRSLLPELTIKKFNQYLKLPNGSAICDLNTCSVAHCLSSRFISNL